MSGIPSIPLYFAGLYFFHGTEKDWFWTGAFICIWILVIRMGWKNYQLMEQINSSQKPDLEIEPVIGDSKPARKHPFYIRILNKNSKLNADDLRVEIISFTDALSSKFQIFAKRYFHPSHFDRIAELKSATGGNTINPDDGLEYIVFFFEPTLVKVEDNARSIVATFDLKRNKPEGNTASFYEGSEYSVKLAASARGMRRIEREFRFSFSTICHLLFKSSTRT